MIETIRHHLPQGITLDCAAPAAPRQPLLLFLHGFPEGAFIWDGVLDAICRPLALRGAQSARLWPLQPAGRRGAYRAKYLVQDLVALIALESPGQPLPA
jgi:pimeloyl-ACP methyl ester carboxylesterase